MLKIKTRRDAQRLRCPRGHVVAPTNRHFWCRSCANHWAEDVESEFDEVRDAETGEMVGREEIEFRGEAQSRVPT